MSYTNEQSYIYLEHIYTWNTYIPVTHIYLAQSVQRLKESLEV
jgi:hypothetical protein